MTVVWQDKGSLLALTVASVFAISGGVVAQPDAPAQSAAAITWEHYIGFAVSAAVLGIALLYFEYQADCQ